MLLQRIIRTSTSYCCVVVGVTIGRPIGSVGSASQSASLDFWQLKIWPDSIYGYLQRRCARRARHSASYPNVWAATCICMSLTDSFPFPSQVCILILWLYRCASEEYAGRSYLIHAVFGVLVVQIGIYFGALFGTTRVASHRRSFMSSSHPSFISPASQRKNPKFEERRSEIRALLARM